MNIMRCRTITQTIPHCAPIIEYVRGRAIKKVRLVIRGGRIVDAKSRRAVAADILVEDDAISAIGEPGLAAVDSVEIDGRDRLLIPGLVNAHTHGHGNLSKALGDRWTLELMHNSLAAMTGRRLPEDKYLAVKIGAVEMVRKGCTAAYDLPFEFPGPTAEGIEAVGKAYTDVGMRAVVAPMVWERTLYEVVPGLYDALSPALRADADKLRLPPSGDSVGALEAVLENWKFDRDQVMPAVSPTIPSYCGEDLLIRLRDLARHYDVGFHTHISESKVQALSAVKIHGRSLVAYLDSLGILGPKFTAAHAVWIDDDDIKRLADAGASVAHNPVCNARLGSGVAAVRRMLDFGLNVGIGTDSCTCSDNLNMFEAMRMSSFMIRLREPDYERWPSANEVLGFATEGSARTLGFGDMIGALTVGRKADIVFLDLNKPHYVPLNEPVNQIVYCEDGTAVDSVMIGGRMVLDHGRMTTVDEAKLKRDAERAVERLLGDANAELRERADRLAATVGKHCVALSRMEYPPNGAHAVVKA
jgi:5-methylthioadenosine/S-adenosylhomocysteine deaminase